VDQRRLTGRMTLSEDGLPSGGKAEGRMGPQDSMRDRALAAAAETRARNLAAAEESRKREKREAARRAAEQREKLIAQGMRKVQEILGHSTVQSDWDIRRVGVSDGDDGYNYQPVAATTILGVEIVTDPCNADGLLMRDADHRQKWKSPLSGPPLTWEYSGLDSLDSFGLLLEKIEKG